MSTSHRLGRAVAGALAVAAPLWLLDLAIGGWRQGFAGLSGSLTSLGLWQLGALALALLGVLLVPAGLRMERRIEACWLARRQRDQFGLALASLWVVAVLTAASALAFAVIGRLEGRFATAHYVALAQVLVVFVALALGLLVAVRGWSLLRRIEGPAALGVLPLAAAGLGLIFLLYGFLWWRRDLVFKEIDPWPPLALALLAAGVVAVVLMAPRLPRPKPWSLLGAMALMLSTLIWAGSSRRTAGALQGRLPLASLLAPSLRSMTDWDGDGISGWLGGGDCAPWDPAVFPGAIDYPDDGIDQDCVGGDLRAEMTGKSMDPNFVDVPAARRPQLIVLVSVDALRPDYLGFYGYSRRPTSPSLDHWARGAAVFEAAFTSGPYTSIALPSMLTGLGMGQLPGYVQNLYDDSRPTPSLKLPESATTVAESLKAAGYRTAAIVSGLDPKANRFGQGFESVEVISKRSFDTADKVSAAARRWLAENPDGKRLLWLHYFDPHDPYFRDVGPGFGAGVPQRYASSIAFMDKHLGPLLNEVAARPAALSVLVSDHGESLGEGGRLGHGFSLARHEAQVVMAWRGLGIEARRLGGAVGLTDVTPTLRNLVGLEPTPSSGESLAGVLAGGPQDEARGVLSESYRRGQHYALNTAAWRLIYHMDENRFELFDAKNDPEERRDLAEDKPAVVASLQPQLQALMRRGGATLKRGRQVRQLLVDRVPKAAALERPVLFGDAIELLGLEQTTVGPEAEPLHAINFYFRAKRRMETSWRVALALSGPKPLNKDHFPGKSYFPTHKWPPGQIIKDPVIIGTMSKFPAATWRMSLGFYSGSKRLLPAEDSPIKRNRSGSRVLLPEVFLRPMPWAVKRAQAKRKRDAAEKAARAAQLKASPDGQEKR